MNAFRVGEVEIERPVVRHLLLEADVERVDARVFVIATKHAHAAEARKRIADRTSTTQGATLEGGATTPGHTGPGTPDEMIGVFRKIVCCCTPLVVIDPTCDSMFCRA